MFLVQGGQEGVQEHEISIEHKEDEREEEFALKAAKESVNNSDLPHANCAHHTHIEITNESLQPPIFSHRTSKTCVPKIMGIPEIIPISSCKVRPIGNLVPSS